MSDVNIQTFSGKVNVTDNFKVGAGHLFVDTQDNKVGLNTATPNSSLHVNGNAYVATDITFGGTLTGDGSGLTNVGSGPWSSGTGNVYLSTTTDKVGIGTTSPLTPLHISSTNEITTSPAGSAVSQMRYGSTNSTVLFGVSSTAGHISAYDTSNFSTNRNLCFNADGGNVGIGTNDPGCLLMIYGGTGVNSTGGVLSVRQKGDTVNDGITLTSSHSNSTRMYKDGNGHFYLHNTGGGYFTFENGTGDVGIGTTSPDAKLHVNGNAIIGDRGGYSDHTDAQLTLGGSHNTTAGYNTNNQIKLLISGGNNDGDSPYYIMCEDENGFDLFYLKGSTSHGGAANMYMNANVGIGVTSPATRLEVKSNARFSGGTANSYVQIDTNGSIWRNYHGSHGAGIHFTDSAVIPANHGGGDHGGINIDVGTWSYPWRNLFLGYGVYANDAFIRNNASVTNQLYTYEVNLRQQRHVSSYGSTLTWPNNGHHIDCYRAGSGHDFHINHYAQRPVHLNRSSYSDHRIKEDIRDINDSIALETLRKIKPKTYRYKLKPDRGVVYGFIAQDVREILPYATNLTTLSAPFDREDFVDANILEDGTVELTSPCEQIEVGKNAMFFYESSITTRDFTVLEITNSTRFKVEVDSLNKEWLGHTKLVGKEVEDFHGIDKDAIFTVATAALQEVDRQQQAEKQKVLELEKERYEQNKKIELLEMSHAALIQRIEALENM